MQYHFFTILEGGKGYFREPRIACFIPRELWNHLPIPRET